VDLRLSELQELIRENAEDFLTNEVPASRVREIEWAGRPDEALWKQFVDLGWTGLPIGEAYGGQGGGLVDLAVLIEQLCRHAVPSPYQQTMLAAIVIDRFGDEALKQAVLPRIVAGATVSPALKEGRDALLHGKLATAVKAGSLSGQKRFVEFAETSDYHLVAAKRGRKTGLAVVPRNQPGVGTTAQPSIGATPQADVTYDGAAVEGWIDSADAVDQLRLIGSAITSLECYAHAQAALDMTVEYVQLRVAFGRPIGTFEMVQLRCADVATLVKAARFLAYELLYNLDRGIVDPAQVAKVKAVTSKTVVEATNWGHILHGGVGFMAEYDLQFHTRRGKEASLRWGDPRESLTAVADAVLGPAR
jgi:alkylation response protein AidB-like acyl-CoA dehydrogenase